MRNDTKAFAALLKLEKESAEFDVWIAAERVAREYGVAEASLIAEYDNHCEALKEWHDKR